MTAIAIQAPFPTIPDIDGQPLEDGYIWIGVANLAPITNPITVYWDAALTLPAAQPVRTLGGYPMNSGTPGRLYAATDYSILVQNKTGSTVYSSADDNGPLFGGTISSVDVTFLQAGTGAVERTAQSKMRDVVSVKDFGAVGDGVADDTVAVHAAINAMKAVDGTVFFPAGKYRVTSGYTNSTQGQGVTLLGEGMEAFATNASNANGSCIILDNASASSFFYKRTAGSQLNVRNMQFACAQYALDRAFFVTTTSNAFDFFDNVHFVAVEQPFVYDTGTYFQMCHYKDIRFTNSGSWHSKVSNLAGTLMFIENCYMEGTVPANTEQIICNLQGIRQITAVNFLIEPAVPGAGWTALKLYQTYNASWTRQTYGTFINLWIEVTGFPITYAIQQIGGSASLVNPGGFFQVSNPIRLESSAAVEIIGASYTGTITDPLQNYFSFGDFTCQVKLSRCTYRNPGTAISDPRFTFENCSLSPSGTSALQTATSHSNAQSKLMWAFDGGYPDPAKVLVSLFGGTTANPSTDATYGRALRIVPNAGNINVRYQIYTRSNFPQGGQFFAVLRGVLPTFASGLCEIRFLVDGVVQADLASYTTASSGAAFFLCVPITTPTANPANIGVVFNSSSASTDWILQQFEMWVGKSLPNVTLPSYQSYVQTYAAAAPLAGTWAIGDRVFNSVPTVGQPKSWVCTVAGTPGTWVSEGNL